MSETQAHNVRKTFASHADFALETSDSEHHPLTVLISLTFHSTL